MYSAGREHTQSVWMTCALTFQKPKKIDCFSVPCSACSSQDQRVFSGIVSIPLMHSHGGEMNESVNFSSSNLSFFFSFGLLMQWYQNLPQWRLYVTFHSVQRSKDNRNFNTKKKGEETHLITDEFFKDQCVVGFPQSKFRLQPSEHHSSTAPPPFFS